VESLTDPAGPIVRGGSLNVVTWGVGDRAVCVHGSLSWGAFAFRSQRPLAHSHALVLPDRRGYGGTAGRGRADFEVDADDVAELLGVSAHLVGHSYGAVVALLAAARRPDAVRTLTLVEPAAFAVARGEATVEELIFNLEGVYAAGARVTPAEFGIRFLEAFGYIRGLDMPEHPKLTPDARRAAITTMTERPPWQAEIPLDALERTAHPTLVVSGGWDNLASSGQAVGHKAIGAVCDTLVRALDARRVTIGGWAHGCQYSGKPFNDALQSFWENRAAWGK
jgi:pimeloyl-ACP methyl ester carboxylesterase